MHFFFFALRSWGKIYLISISQCKKYRVHFHISICPLSFNFGGEIWPWTFLKILSPCICINSWWTSVKYTSISISRLCSTRDESTLFSLESDAGLMCWSYIYLACSRCVSGYYKPTDNNAFSSCLKYINH